MILLQFNLVIFLVIYYGYFKKEVDLVNSVDFFNLIFQYVSEMTKAIKENKGLNDAGWDNPTVLTEEHEVSEYFRCCVFLTVKTY